MTSKWLSDWLNLLDYWIWSRFLFVLLIFIGLLLTFRLRGMQFRYLGYALKLAFTRHDDQEEGDISHFQALMTALAATIGIGSIAGVATAVVGGGFGAIFWMWVIALIGMATKFSEAVLAIKFRIKDRLGQICGGPMHYIDRGLKWKWLAVVFALFGILSSFAGGNMTQAHSIADAFFHLTGISPVWTGAILALITGFVLIGGIVGISRFCAILVPAMAAMYILGGLLILVIHYDRLLPSLDSIFRSALFPRAAIGGVGGAGIIAALQFGVARGISSNEAGLGSGPIAAAAAKTDVPGRQAMISMTTVFLSTIVVCTITALVISVTGVLGSKDGAGNVLNGAPLVMAAFRSTIPYGQHVVAIGLMLFGYSTIVGWSYYGEKCLEYLLGERSIYPFRFFFTLLVFLGSLLSIDIVWPLVDIMNGLMALPNLIALLFLSTVAVRESRQFFQLVAKEKSMSA